MRKAISDNVGAAMPLTIDILDKLLKDGWRFVQVKGITADLHYEHIDPHHFVLIPMKQLPVEQGDKDIYEPVDSDLLKSWARQADGTVAVYVFANH